MVQVFREVRRVLRDDGTLWLNLGDSFSGGGSGRRDSQNHITRSNGTSSKPSQKNKEENYKARNVPEGYKPKDLLGIPWAVAFALRADGWYLRSDIVWHKPNPMPESVTDRPTRSHEYIFLLSKSPHYYYDAQAISEKSGGFKPGGKTNGLDNPKTANQKKKQDSLGKGTYTGFNDRWKEKPVQNRNKRDVWTVATEPYSEAHFATFPPKLIEPCILAGSPPPGGVVLDPFMGAGTTALVANRNGRKAVGVELNPEYCELIRRRIAEDGFAMTESSDQWL